MPSISESTAVMMQTSALSLSETTIESRSACCVESLTRMSYQYVEKRPEAGNDVRPREPWNESSVMSIVGPYMSTRKPPKNTPSTRCSLRPSTT